ncbi:GroES-like protein [Epithele typhae]|uniref:GroES-like protein n=1 Tax=Epithele typhae TaxID=378194 RepID=UPI0020089E8D|nr:GroES-like protein [Epithele typhae]KAH9917884.1 GroES-like protein [Epithele typhae]
MSTPTTQKAFHFTEVPPQGKFAIAERPVPTPGDGEVLVRVEAAALNPIDWKLTSSPEFAKMMGIFPLPLGTDGAGVVEAVGSGVTTLSKGDKIVFQGWFAPDKATFQQYAIVNPAFAAKIPANISLDQAASLPLGLMTVLLGLYSPASTNSLNLPPFWATGPSASAGTPALILGGASSVGQYAIQAAKLAGHSPIITTASPRNTSLLTSLGATHVLDRSLSVDALVAAIKGALGGKPLLFAYDAITYADTQAVAVRALAPEGKLVIVNAVPMSEEDTKAAEGKTVVMTQGNVNVPFHNAVGAEIFAQLSGWLEKGDIKPNSVEVLPKGLAGIQDGLKRMEENKVSAVKLIAHPQEMP